MPTLTLPHIEIEYEEHGDPRGRPALLLHGFPDCAAGWGDLLAAWSATEGATPVRFVVPSLRGYGATRITDPEAETGEFAALADDALLLLEHLGIEHAVVIGHDWGARAAYSMAVLQPTRIAAVIGLASEYVAYGNTGILPHAQERDYWYQWFFNTPQGEASLTRDRAGLCRLLWQVWSPTWHFAETALEQAARSWQNPQFVSTVVSYYRVRHGNARGSARYAAQHALLAEKPAVTVATWYILGTADACNHPEGSLGQEAWFAGSYERVEVPGIGHFVHREAPMEVASVLARALLR